MLKLFVQKNKNSRFLNRIAASRRWASQPLRPSEAVVGIIHRYSRNKGARIQNKIFRRELLKAVNLFRTSHNLSQQLFSSLYEFQCRHKNSSGEGGEFKITYDRLYGATRLPSPFFPPS